MCVFLPQEKKKKRMFKDKKRPIFNFVLKVGRMGNILPYLIVVSLFIGEGNGNPLQDSCLENPRDRGAGGLPYMGSHRVGHDWSDSSSNSSSLFITCKYLDIYFSIYTFAQVHKFRGRCNLAHAPLIISTADKNGRLVLLVFWALSWVLFIQ